MNLYPVFFMLIQFIIATADDPTHTIGGDVSINCGSSGVSAVHSGREWLGDVKKIASSIVEVMGSSTKSTVIHHNSILDPVPYETARLSFSQFSYAFRVNPGAKILRLHFNPAPYKGFKSYKDFFSVEAGPFTLLSNFSVSLAANVLGVNSLVKEFCITIEENQLLSVVFSPASSPLQDLYAFVSGIEIISIPAARSYFHTEEDEVQLVGKSSADVDKSNALEIIRRLNTKRDYVSSSSSDYADDELGTWDVVPKKNEKKVKSVTWKTSVGVGFRYLVRLHFSIPRFKTAEIDGFIFEVHINGKMVDTSFDPMKQREDDRLQWYTDYMVAMKGGKLEGMRDILIVLLHTNDEFLDGHGPVKGFEILKLSNLDNSLAGPNPMGSVNNPSRQTLHIFCRVFGGHKNVIASGAVALLVLVNVIVNILWIIQEGRHLEKEMMIEEENMPSVKAARLCRQFSLAEIQSATQNFSEMNRIGRGGFGKVYKGEIDNGAKTVAVKRLKSNSRQGARQFLTEIETLTELRHVNLVSLIGYCNECKEMILVYEYMASGTLADHLFNLELTDDNTPSLTWKQLLNICIGAGRGLDYLHTGHSIIHRDVKASNILLDEHFRAKVADFGLAKPLGPTNLEKSHVSTKVSGTFGYWDPEYLATGKLTKKSDSYSFGVVLLEVLSGRRASDPRVSIDEQNLTRWAKENISKGKFDHLVSLKLRGQISEDSLKAFVDIVERCLRDEPKKRPTMAEVVLQLQHALEPPEGSQHTALNEKSNLDDNHPSNDETESSTSTLQFKNPFEDGYILSSPMKEQFDTNAEPATGVKDPRKSRLPKFSRLWPWGAHRNKSEPSANNEILMSGPHVEAPGRKDEHAINSTPIGTSSSPPSELNGEFMSGDSKSSNQKWVTELIAVPAIPFDELKGMTGNFGQKSFQDEDLYHVILKNGQEAALKVLKHNKQTDQEFLIQVSKLSSLKHENLAELLGYSMGGGQRILAYEHAARGSLHDILHGQEGGIGGDPGSVLSWIQRVKIAECAAKGLEYLHEMEHVHGHFKSSNILAFDHGSFVAKITDFHFPRSNKVVEEDPLFYISRECAGNGYHSVIEPATPERDVYDFGVVLLELLTGHKPFDLKLAYGKKILVKWVRPYLSKDKVNQCVDVRLGQMYPPKAAAKMAKIAEICVQSDPSFRPPMRVIVEALQSLLNVAHPQH